DPAAVGAQGARKLHLQLASDHRSIRLTGELFKTSGMLKRNQSWPRVLVPLEMVQQRRSPAQHVPVTIAATLTVPGSALLALPEMPPDWVDTQRQLRLEVQDGKQKCLSESPLPPSTTITIRGRPCTLTAAPLGDHVRIDLSEARPGTTPSAN